MAYWFLATAFFTDALDGWLAKKLSIASPEGGLNDQIADAALLLVVALTLVYLQLVPTHLWISLIVLLLWLPRWLSKADRRPHLAAKGLLFLYYIYVSISLVWIYTYLAYGKWGVIITLIIVAGALPKLVRWKWQRIREVIDLLRQLLPEKLNKEKAG